MAEVLRLERCEPDHSRRDVEADHATARGSGLEGDVAGSAGEIQNRRVCWRRDFRDEPPLPTLVETARQQDGDQVVAVRDRSEQRADVLALALRRGEPILPLHFAKKILPDIIAE